VAVRTGGDDRGGEGAVIRKRPFSVISESSDVSKATHRSKQDTTNESTRSHVSTSASYTIPSNLQPGRTDPAAFQGRQGDSSHPLEEQDSSNTQQISTNPTFSSFLSLTPGGESQLAVSAVTGNSDVCPDNAIKASNSAAIMSPATASTIATQDPTSSIANPSTTVPYYSRGTVNTLGITTPQQSPLSYQSQQPYAQPQLNLLYINPATGAATLQLAGAGSNQGHQNPNALMLPGAPQQQQQQQQQQPMFYPIQSQTTPLMNAANVQRLSHHCAPLAPTAPVVVMPNLPTMVAQGQQAFTDNAWLNQNNLGSTVVSSFSNERNEMNPVNGSNLVTISNPDNLAVETATTSAASTPQMQGELQSTFPGKFGMNNILSGQLHPGRDALSQAPPPVQQAAAAMTSVANAVAPSFDLAQNQLQHALNAHLTDPKNATLNSGSEVEPLTLYMRLDHDQLSEYQVLVRKQLEIYTATQEDVNVNAQGRKKQVYVGQIGLMCRHCSFLSTPNRAKGSLYFPNALDGLYQAAQNMARTHLRSTCQYISPLVKSELGRLSKVREKAIGGKQYWADGARALGMYDSRQGIRLDRNRAGPKQDDYHEER